MRSTLYALYAIAIVMTPSLAFSGGVLDVLQYERKPLLQSNKGQITGCGIHFSGAVSNHQAVFGIQGSYNLMFMPNQYPGLAYKLVVVAPNADGKSLSRKKVAFAYLRTKTFSTADWKELDNKEPDYFSYFKAAKEEDLKTIIESATDVPFSDGWMGFNINDGQDYTFRVPQIKKEQLELHSQVGDCVKLGLKQMIGQLAK